METPDETRKQPEEVPAIEARDRLTDLMNRAGFGNERIVLTRHGKPIAALVGMKDFESLPQNAAA